jgi:hypothetical protein
MYQGRNSDRLRNSEEAWERVEEFRIEGRAESDHLEVASRKRRGGTEQRMKGVGDRNKTNNFFGIAVLCLKKCNQESIYIKCFFCKFDIQNKLSA